MLSTPPAGTAVELTEKRMFMLFPTPMFMGKLPDMSVCDRVEKKVRELQKSGKGKVVSQGGEPCDAGMMIKSELSSFFAEYLGSKFFVNLRGEANSVGPQLAGVL